LEDRGQVDLVGIYLQQTSLIDVSRCLGLQIHHFHYRIRLYALIQLYSKTDIAHSPVVILLVSPRRSWFNLVSFAGLGFLALFIAGRLNAMDTRGQVWKILISLIPLVSAGMIAITRVMDNRLLHLSTPNNRHHPFDVIFGGVLGLSFAWMAYRQYFPALSCAESGRPYSIAIFSAGALGTEKSDSTVVYQSQSSNLELGLPR
jgi:PAP2 superfamily